jgi:Sortase domain
MAAHIPPPPSQHPHEHPHRPPSGPVPGPPEGAAAAGPRADERSTTVLRWAVAAALLGVLLIYNSANGSGTALPAPEPVQAAVTTPAGSSGAPSAPSAPAAPAGGTPRGPGLARSAPTELSIPAIGLKAPFTPLTLDAEGRLNAPPENDSNVVGWYADGPTPGEHGSAIVAGHVDTRTGPGVFLLLSLLKPGSTVDITRTDRSVATFTVDSVESFAKDDFPDERVYGNTPDAQLRLITCGGTYDRAKRDYLKNVVVFARLTSSRQG